MSDITQAVSCPEPEDLGSYVDGTADARTIDSITAHIATCNDCLDAVHSSIEFRREERAYVPAEPATSPRWVSRRATWLAIAAVAIVAFLGVATFRELIRGGSGPSLESLADAAPHGYRLVEPRLSGFPWAPMRRFRDEDSRSGADAAYLKMAGTAGDVLSRAGSDDSADAAHAAGVAKLLLRDSSSAVAWLETASNRSPGDAHVWSDLAAAHLVRALQEKRPAELPLALAAVDRALKLDPRLSDARFNRALILEQLGMRAEAEAAWRAYLEVDSRSPWAAEARQHLDKVHVG